MYTTNGIQLLTMALKCHKIENDLAASTNLSVNELNCLLQIYLERPCCVRMLTSSLGIRGTSTSKYLRSLDRRGLITRTLGQRDRRQEQVVLTEAGLLAVCEVLDHAESVVEQILRQIPADRVQCFTRCLSLFPLMTNRVPHLSATKTKPTTKGELS